MGPERDPSKIGKAGPRVLVEPYQKSTKTGNMGPWTLVGPYEKPENRDPSRTLQKTGKLECGVNVGCE